MDIRKRRLEITTAIGCKVACSACPQTVFQKAYQNKGNKNYRSGFLTMNSFQTLLQNVDRDTLICFAGFSEPWGNPACTDMVLYAYEKGYSVAAYTTLSDWKEEDFLRLKHVSFEEFVVHLPDRNLQSHIVVDERYCRLLKKVVSHEQNGKHWVSGFSCHGEIHPDIISIVPKTIYCTTQLNNRAGNLQNEEYLASKNVEQEILCVRCADRVDQNLLLPDGSVVLCCMDYGMEHLLGNLYDSSYSEILQSQEANRIRCAMHAGGEMILCRKCINGKNIRELYTEYQTYYSWAMQMYEEKITQPRRRAE